MNQKNRALAILAPVPEKHLIAGLEAIAAQYDADTPLENPPRLALGTMDFEVFRKADELRGEKLLTVFIYAVDSKESQSLNPVVSWKATYVKHSPSRRGRYAGPAHYRPATAASDPPTWAVFWEVQDLERMKIPLAIANFKAIAQKANLKARFIPDSPILVEHP
jgi:hypothetical protein